MLGVQNMWGGGGARMKLGGGGAYPPAPPPPENPPVLVTMVSQHLVPGAPRHRSILGL